MKVLNDFWIGLLGVNVFCYREIMVIDVERIIINTCKTNQLITVNVIPWGQSNFTIENGKLTIGENIVSFVVSVSFKYTLKWVTCSISIIQRKFLGINFLCKGKKIRIVFTVKISSKYQKLLLNKLIIG